MSADPNLLNLERQLPFLPGTRFDFGKEHPHYRKSHAFDYCNGVAIFQEDRPGIGGAPLPGQDATQVHTSADIYARAESSKGEATQVLPAWVAFDRKVLRFYGYFREAVQESRLEQYRIRRVNIYFYLEDDSIHVSEPQTPSSGIPQGTLIRRHRIPKGEGNVAQHFTVSDFNVGEEVTFYSRTFKIVGCDEFSRDFLQNLGFQVPDNQIFPVGPYETHLEVQKGRMRATRPVKKDLGLKKFLENDRRVLRFNCVWDDSSSALGARRQMILHLYLSDDTIEIKEEIPPNSGRDPNSLFLKRCRLPKRPRVNPVNGPPAEENPNDYYNERDLTIGAVLHLYGRPFLIVDCDEFTKEFYREKYGLETFDPVRVDSPLPSNAITYEIPAAAPLIPRAPRRDFKKLMAYDGVTLRYSAKLVSNKQIDRDRKFIISYFLADDTISVFEPHQRNSGIVGGKFLERRKFRKDGTSVDPHAENQEREDNYYTTADLFLGAQMTLCNHIFQIVGADDHAIKFMEEHPEAFPHHKA